VQDIECGKIYSEICRGYSSELIDGLLIYFKHPSVAEHFSIYSYYDIFLEHGKNKGLQSEKEKIEEAIEGGWWTSEKESKINFLKKTVQNLYKTRDKLLYASQKIEIEAQIKQNEAILITYNKERREIVGYTLEDYVNSKFTEELLIFFSYKNKEFTERLFPDRSEYYNLTEAYVEKIKNAFDTYGHIFDTYNIKKIAASGFFQNLVYLNDDAYSFWGKPTTQCTKYQINLLLFGKMYKNISKNYSEAGKPIPEEISNDPEKFIEWIDNQSGSSSSRPIKSSKNTISSYVGATKDDLNKLGIKIEKLKGKSLLDLAAEKGGTLEKGDYFAARENS
jgi:hypothetical protein